MQAIEPAPDQYQMILHIPDYKTLVPNARNIGNIISAQAWHQGGDVIPEGVFEKLSFSSS